MKRKITIIGMLLLMVASAFAQSFTVSGKVVSEEDGAPLPGTNVLIKGTRTGTITDADGEFKISGFEKGEYILVFSYVGYQTTETSFTVEGDKSLEIKLKVALTNHGEAFVYSQKTYPITKTDIPKHELQKNNLGQDLPILLNFTPSLVTTSDAGNGVGYTGIRIRGSDPTRINVTLNGVPLNDSESQGVYWVNMPDFATTVDNVSIQRGVGSSVNGAGAFGASVNVTTSQPNDFAYAETSNSYGSFNTLKNNIVLNTGKINDKFSMLTRVSRITSDGFIDKASSDLKSLYMSGKYESKAGTFTGNVILGKEVTFQAWNGVPEEKILEGDRTYNELAGYDNEVDNYNQDHYQFMYNKALGAKWNLNAVAHYTRGKGYFEQKKYDDDLASYNLDDVVLGDTTITSTDLIRRRWLDNHFGGLVYSLDYNSDARLGNSPVLGLTFGGGWNLYEGKHFGEVIWARYSSNGEIRHRYYDNDATKKDFNFYGKANYQAKENLFLFADMQVRTINYEFLGFDNDLNNVTQSDDLLFFNPKVGARYYFGASEVYGSFAVGNKEPNRSDYTESTPDSRPKHETLNNVELGYSRSFGKSGIAVNYYYMDYKNQLVLTGKINDVGEYGRQNIDKSYRTGLELQWYVQLGEKLTWNANATFSQNKIGEFVEYLDDYDNGGQQEINYGETDIAFSPNVVGSSQLSFKPFKGGEITLLSKYVGKQYLDNTSTETRKLDPYFVNDIRLSYGLSSKSFKNVDFTFLINNIFNVKYESNGYTYGYIWGGETARQNYYYPQAGTNFLAGLRIRI
ncbi:TonB-dependent receptor [Flammeovirgaceae bacterium SG7u.111]|nr:TonB-dependent receptor [Flammeovirgaceae bacterium SG7u.132]WPO35829.1 TonB-dependent receptor [Flammeovirgaceae bacterium SG7u.111]